MTPSLRRAQEADLDVLAILFDGYRQFYRQPADLAGARIFLAERIGRGESVIFVAEDERGALGFTQLYPSFTSAGMARIFILNDLFVAPEARGIDLKPSAFTHLTGSIADRAFVREAMQGVRTVLHTATLHKPHVVTHSHSQFVDTNVTGTLNLLEEAADAGVGAFVQTSTTSAFGDALSPAVGTPAAWITEDVLPIPKNIYGATKLAAEHLCRVVAKKRGLPVVVLRVSRFFPEEDDAAEVREAFSNANIQALELLYRRADIEDMALAHFAAMERAPAIGFGMAIVSATSPFTRDDLPLLNSDARAVILRHFPQADGLFAAAGWNFLDAIDRVYVNDHARALLGWEPQRGFAHVLRCLERGEDFRSELARAIGKKGYHDEVFAEGPYPV